MIKVIYLLGLMAMALIAETRDVPDLFGPQEENYLLRLTTRVLTEDGKPLENVDVHVAIENFNDFKDGSNDIRGKTDEEGKFSAEGIGRPVAAIIASHEGYYPSRKDYGNWNNFEEARKTGKYIPWDQEINLTLRKVGKSVPMMVWLGNEINRNVSPDPGGEVGYDMFVHDWISPHGKGKVSDLLITLDLQPEDDKTMKVKGEVKFGNEDDGLIPISEFPVPESLLKYPRVAPKEGYEVKLVNPFFPIGVNRSQAAVKEPVGYMFRIRTSKDKSSGKILSAYYGKIVAPVGYTENANPFVVYSFRRKDDRHVFDPYIEFSYYLNPTPNDRNLEYDQRSNLAPGADKGSVYPP
jgi:hypothetical protein